METTSPQPAGIWQGEPSGQRFAALLSERASQTGIRVTVDVVPVKEVGGYLVNIHWEAEPDDGLLYEVVDWVNGSASWTRTAKMSPSNRLWSISLRVPRAPHPKTHSG